MNTKIRLQQFWACGFLAARYGLSIIVLLAADLAAAQEQPPTGNPIDVITLPRDLSPWGMFMQADIVVKAVMIGLVFASVLTWTIWLAKTIELFGARRRLARAHEALEATRSLGEAAQSASQASRIGKSLKIVRPARNDEPSRRRCRPERSLACCA